MSESEVVDPAGNRWVVRRRWTPRWIWVGVGKRFRRARRDSDGTRPWWDVIDLPFDAIDDVRALVLIPVIIVVLLILWFAVIPLLLLVVDVLIVIVLFLVGLTARVLLRRPWTVVATRHDGAEIQREVVGWRASRVAIATLRNEIEVGFAEPVAGVDPP